MYWTETIERDVFKRDGDIVCFHLNCSLFIDTGINSLNTVYCISSILSFFGNKVISQIIQTKYYKI